MPALSTLSTYLAALIIRANDDRGTRHNYVGSPESLHDSAKNETRWEEEAGTNGED